MSSLNEKYDRFVHADEVWMKEIKSTLKGRPGDVRYTKAAEGEPGTALNAAYREFVEAREDWRAAWRVPSEASLNQSIK